MKEIPTTRMEIPRPEAATEWVRQFASGMMDGPATAREIYQSMMDNSPFVFLLKDEDGRLVWCNRLCAERWKIRREDWIGKLDTERWPAEEARLTRQRDLAVLASARVVETWEKELRSEGVVRYWATYRFPFRDEGGRRYIASLATDATRMAEAEMALSRSQQALVQVNQQLTELATTDALTGVRNRRAFDERLRQEFALALRHSLPLSLLLLDVDHFKEFNDRNGHTAGDAALRAVAQLLDGMVRSTDMMARFGGEEFAVILPNTQQEGALVLAARLANAVAANTGAAEGLTLSIGIAAKSPELLNRDRFVAIADEALYRAKSAGRNRIVVSDAVR